MHERDSPSVSCVQGIAEEKAPSLSVSKLKAPPARTSSPRFDNQRAGVSHIALLPLRDYLSAQTNGRITGLRKVGRLRPLGAREKSSSLDNTPLCLCATVGEGRWPVHPLIVRLSHGSYLLCRVYAF
ncbi:uncharacterized protein LAJ45_07061 [Morchella importuna]|uniref:uncharacterized protein n=1 Tax=Morchella importuna TaxID=1174673 RepID=UPI001E8E8B95|nr:uncharacterized protein LAJ45_07061 [Morchella importuna]KAH8148718.1 hypothetical protein LAJ45_07061 [Morchella importuna]